jgi:hypothetical protein
MPEPNQVDLWVESLEPAIPPCAHCEGQRVCACPACTLRRTTDPVPCLMCNARERDGWLLLTAPQGCWHCGGTGRCACIHCQGDTHEGVCRQCHPEKKP